MRSFTDIKDLSKSDIQSILFRTKQEKEVIAEKDFLKILGHKIDYLSKELDKIINEYPKFVVEVRGQGFLRGLKLFDPVNEIQNELKKNKVLFVAAAENVLRLLPPLTVSIEEIDIAISALRKVACKGIK